VTSYGALSLDVHLTGGSAWWFDLLGPMLLSLTAVAAAIIAARTANKRQEEQLFHDRELQKEQLAYDREQRTRQHVRDTIDEAVREWDEAVRAIARYEGRVEKEDSRLGFSGEVADESLSETARSQAKESLSEELGEIAERKEKAQEFAADLISTELRLILRLGESHPVVEAYEAFRGAYLDRNRLLRRINLDVALGDRKSEEIREAGSAMTRAASKFLAACEAWFQESQ
jgi:hypothetical protein